MAKTTKDHLQDVFDDLGEAGQKKFKGKLCDRKVEPRVRRAAIEKAKDSIDLADLMVNTFTTSGSVPVTVEILEAIGFNEQATDLKKNTGQGLSVAPSPVAPSPVAPSPVAPSPVDVVDSGAGQSPKIYDVKDKSVRKRLALLINNIDFDHKEMTRRGADRDEENMEWLLKELDYQVVKHRNLSAKDMEGAVKDFAQRQEHAYSDSTFVVIMSHGKRDAILGVHYTTLNPSDAFPVDKIYYYLNAENCPGETGRVWASDGVPDEPTEIEGDDFVHKEKDFISLMSCTPDTKSYRHVQNGTFYVQNLVDVLMKHAHEDHIEELFRKVLRRFDNSDMMGCYRQMACKDRASLPKLFYLFPGL
ncbi:caspase-1-like protein [Labeo rohita]|uniref:Caspase-1-like protein n=1 Tax=Labeo rohita TaxID=84645 RepID=A0A498NL41_LABRO|nr:caspase-1-like protein [Labeo rohita]